jgi:DNA-binding GntR family transcriptional regulator
MPDATIQKDGTSRSVIRHRVRSQIEQLIYDHSYAPGTQLVQQRLAKQLGVSQAVIRESLFELASVGLVSFDDHKGACVTDLSNDMLFQAYDVREMLEGLAVRQCCLHASRANISELKTLAEWIDQLGKEDRLEEMAKLDRKFHNYLITCSANEVLHKLINVISVLSKAIWAGDKVGRIPVHHLDHIAIVAAIENNDPDEAERLIREHVRRGKARMKKAIDINHDSPRWIR